MAKWPSGLRRCVQVAVLFEGVGSNPTFVKFLYMLLLACERLYKLDKTRTFYCRKLCPVFFFNPLCIFHVIIDVLHHVMKSFQENSTKCKKIDVNNISPSVAKKKKISQNPRFVPKIGSVMSQFPSTASLVSLVI